MRDKLLEMEKKFFSLRFISDVEWLNNVLHKDFKECGKSGILYDKQMTIESLLTCKKDRDIEIYNFEYNIADDNCWLVHYVTKSGGKDYYRTSVWIFDGHLQLLFHQATQLKKK